MSIYHIPAVDSTVANSSQAFELEMVGKHKRVLDVGCATGYLARALVENGCTVSGVEYDIEAAEEARPALEALAVADLNTADLAELFPGETFDSIVFGDVLEHLVGADAVLRSAVRMLAPDGSIVISVPNVTHGSLRLALLQGRWTYTETGLLDRTHVRFFTRESLFDMLRGAGLVVTDLRATVFDPLDSEVEVDDGALPATIVEWVRHQPDAYVYQFLVRAVPGAWDDATVPELVPAVEIREVQDTHHKLAARSVATLFDSSEARTKVLEELESLRHSVLTLRDHAVGAEASLGVARTEVERARAGERDAYDQAERRVAELKRTTSWRLGNALIAPLARVKRAIQGD